VANQKKASQRHISEFGELDGRDGYSGKKKILQECKSSWYIFL